MSTMAPAGESKADRRSSNGNANGGQFIKWAIGVLTALLIFAITAAATHLWGTVQSLNLDSAVMKRDIDYLKDTTKETNENVKALMRRDQDRRN